MKVAAILEHGGCLALDTVRGAVFHAEQQCDDIPLLKVFDMLSLTILSIRMGVTIFRRESRISDRSSSLGFVLVAQHP